MVWERVGHSASKKGTLQPYLKLLANQTPKMSFVITTTRAPVIHVFNVPFTTYVCSTNQCCTQITLPYGPLQN
jgi:hypothetical protein